MNLPRHFTLLVKHDGANHEIQAQTYHPPVIHQPVMSMQIATPGGSPDCNCLVLQPLVMTLAPMKVTLPDGVAGTFTPRMPDGKGGLIGVLTCDKEPV